VARRGKRGEETEGEKRKRREVLASSS